MINIRFFRFNGHKKASPKLIPIEKIIVALKKNYGMEINARMIVPIVSDSIGAVWDIGERPSKWLLKVYPLRKKAFSRVSDEVNLFKYLREKGVFVPDVLAAKNKNGLAAIYFKRNFYPIVVMKYELLRKIDHEHIHQSDLKKVGRAIAKLHTALIGYSNNKRTIYRDTYFNSNKPKLLNIDKLRMTYGKILSQNDIEEISKIDLEINQFLNNQKIEPSPRKATANALDAAVQENLTLSIVHGDLHLGQIAFLPKGDIYIFDFDDRFYGPLAWDLAIFYVHLYTGAKTTFDQWEKSCESFLTGYLTKRTLKQSDQDIIPIMLLFRIRKEIRHYYYLAVFTHQENMIREIFPRCKLARYLLDRVVGD